MSAVRIHELWRFRGSDFGHVPHPYPAESPSTRRMAQGCVIELLSDGNVKVVVSGVF